MPASPLRRSLTEQRLLLLDLLRWIPLCALIGMMAGTASALLLVSLDYATKLRERHVWLILLLAPAGWLVGLLYPAPWRVGGRRQQPYSRADA